MIDMKKSDIVNITMNKDNYDFNNMCVFKVDSNISRVNKKRHISLHMTELRGKKSEKLITIWSIEIIQSERNCIPV